MRAQWLCLRNHAKISNCEKPSAFLCCWVLLQVSQVVSLVYSVQCRIGVCSYLIVHVWADWYTIVYSWIQRLILVSNPFWCICCVFMTGIVYQRCDAGLLLLELQFFFAIVVFVSICWGWMEVWWDKNKSPEHLLEKSKIWHRDDFSWSSYFIQLDLAFTYLYNNLDTITSLYKRQW